MYEVCFKKKIYYNIEIQEINMSVHHNAVDRVLEKLFKVKEFAFQKEDNKLFLLKELENCNVKITIKPDVFNEKREALIQVLTKQNQELFSIQQMPEGFSPNYVVKVNNSTVSYQVANQMFLEANMEALMIAVEKQMDTNIQNKLDEYRREEDKRQQSVLDYFNVEKYYNPPGHRLTDNLTGAKNISDLFKYIIKTAPENLFSKDENGFLYFATKLDSGEARIELNSKKAYGIQTPSIKFSDESGKEIFSLHKEYDQFNEFFSFDMFINEKIVDRYEAHLILASIPTVKLYNQIVNSITNNLNEIKEKHIETQNNYIQSVKDNFNKQTKNVEDLTLEDFKCGDLLPPHLQKLQAEKLIKKPEDIQEPVKVEKEVSEIIVQEVIENPVIEDVKIKPKTTTENILNKIGVLRNRIFNNSSTNKNKLN
jgi:hypothetical protein